MTNTNNAVDNMMVAPRAWESNVRTIAREAGRKAQRAIDAKRARMRSVR